MVLGGQRNVYNCFLFLLLDSASVAKWLGTGLEDGRHGDSPWLNHSSHLRIGIWRLLCLVVPGIAVSVPGLVAQCQYRVTGETASLICNFYLCVAACKLVYADLSLRRCTLSVAGILSNQETTSYWTVR